MMDLKPGMTLQSTANPKIRVTLVSPISIWLVEKYELEDGEWIGEGGCFMNIEPNEIGKEFEVVKE